MRVKRTYNSGTLRFIFIAVVFMLLADHFLFGGKSAYIEQARQTYYTEQIQQEQDLIKKEAPVRVEPDDGKAYFESEEPPVAAAPETAVPTAQPPKVDPPKQEAPVMKPAALPPVTHPDYKGHPKIAIVIDDLGMDIRRSREVVEDLPAPVTLAFLPYGTKTKELSVIGKQKGHHLIVHTPMEADDAKLDIGPMGLKTGMSDEMFERSFNSILQSFDGYEGINNHMGSRLTQDGPAMAHLMQMLKAHHLYFLDSKTIASSVAAEKAREAGIPYTSRDVFLDNDNTKAFVDSALQKLERLALHRGYAVAIGHPRDATIAELKAWIPTLKAKGIDLVPVKDLLEYTAITKEPTAAVAPELPAPVTPTVSVPASPEPAPQPVQPQIQSPLPY